MGSPTFKEGFQGQVYFFPGTELILLGRDGNLSLHSAILFQCNFYKNFHFLLTAFMIAFFNFSFC